MDFKKFSINGITYGTSDNVEEKDMLTHQYLGDEPISNVNFKDDRIFNSIINRDDQFRYVDNMVLNLAINHTLIIETNSTKPCKVKLPPKEENYLK
jgi:hypothetical protein